MVELEAVTGASSTMTTPFIPVYHTAMDITYGTVCCLCCVLGLLGNIVSFAYFRAKKNDVSNTVYKIIAVSDALICVNVLPTGICFLNDRNPGFLFANPILCNIWIYLWNTNARLSIFLVVVLCSTRTFSLLRPFSRQHPTTVVLIIAVFVVLQVLQFAGIQFLVSGTTMAYYASRACCAILFMEVRSEVLTIFLDIAANFTFVFPIFAVSLSCLLSIRTILKARCGAASPGQTVLRHSRHRATFTILLFAGVYAVFNIPVVVSMVLWTVDAHSGYRFNFHSFDHRREFFAYYESFTFFVSIAINSTINPALYFWRMPSFRSFVKSRFFPGRWAGQRVDATIALFPNRSCANILHENCEIVESPNL